ncbi:hypothetical protein F4819DRAFT_460019 [Hypoxylon fuscum]|nr:hypothetical protein F4819DRAFT_460019 [Hypoxylon fuscum]
MLANRISYVFNLKDTSCVLYTTCSSSSYTFYVACSPLLTDEYDSAAVAGVYFVQAPDLHVAIF